MSWEKHRTPLILGGTALVYVLVPWALSSRYAVDVWSDGSAIILMALIMAVQLRNALRSNRAIRGFWTLLIIGTTLWAINQGIWFWYEVTRQQEMPDPYFGDPVLFLHVVPMMAAALLLPHLPENNRRLYFGTLNTLILLTWWVFVYVFVVFPREYVLLDIKAYSLGFDILYLLETGLVVVIVALAATGASGRWRRLYWHFSGAMATYTIGSTALNWANTTKTYYSGSLYDAPYAVALVWFYLMGKAGDDMEIDPTPAGPGAEAWIRFAPRLATLLAMSVPIFGLWTVLFDRSPIRIRGFRITITLAATSILEGWIFLKHHLLDNALRRLVKEKEDFLTGLPNRRMLLDHLRQALAASKRSGHKGALLFVDLDHFKMLNDTLGHHVGDLFLQEMARRLTRLTRQTDTVARLGGDEFVVLLPNLSERAETAANQAEKVAEKILAGIDQPLRLQGRECRSSCSIGIALFGEAGDNINEILQQGDIAMYQAKAAGRKTIRFFAPSLQEAVNARVALEEDLRYAIKTGAFALYYQPQVSEGVITGAEALLRWNSPKHGFIPPQKFIPLAEETGLILPLGDWVLESACQQIADWAAAPQTAHLRIAVNISAKQLLNPAFTENVLTILRRTGANADNLELELTESTFVDKVEEAIARMTELKSYGLRFSLDDFGTGYSSLSYLRRLPLDQLKIDKAFVRDLLRDKSSSAIAQSIITLSKALGLSVIAEGVETEEQREFLARLGCPAFQGFLFSEPLPLEEFKKRLPVKPKSAVAART